MQIQCEIFKSAPRETGKGQFVTYTVDAEPSDMVLDVLETIYHKYDPTLSYRYACGVARCGECAMVINGEPCMACDKAVEPVLRIEPLHHLPVIKDTVIHRRKVFDHIHEILPEAGNIENISQSLEALDEKKAKEKIENSIRLTTCFECLICQSECPRYLQDGDGFPGPLGLLMLAQMRENPAQKPISEHWQEMLTASCLHCGKCLRHCPASQKPLEFALSLLRCSPKRSVRVMTSPAGKTEVREVFPNG